MFVIRIQQLKILTTAAGTKWRNPKKKRRWTVSRCRRPWKTTASATSHVPATNQPITRRNSTKKTSTRYPTRMMTTTMMMTTITMTTTSKYTRTMMKTAAKRRVTVKYAFHLNKRVFTSAQHLHSRNETKTYL